MHTLRAIVNLPGNTKGILKSHRNNSTYYGCAINALINLPLGGPVHITTRYGDSKARIDECGTDSLFLNLYASQRAVDAQQAKPDTQDICKIVVIIVIAYRVPIVI